MTIENRVSLSDICNKLLKTKSFKDALTVLLNNLDAENLQNLFIQIQESLNGKQFEGMESWKDRNVESDPMFWKDLKAALEEVGTTIEGWIKDDLLNKTAEECEEECKETLEVLTEALNEDPDNS